MRNPATGAQRRRLKRPQLSCLDLTTLNDADTGTT